MSSSYKGGAPQAPWWRAARGNAFVQWRMRQCRRRTWSSLLAVLLLAGAVALPAAAQCAILNCDFIQLKNGANAMLSTDYSTGANDVAQTVYGYAHSHPKQFNEARRVTSRDAQPALGSQSSTIARTAPEFRRTQGRLLLARAQRHRR